VSSVAESQPRPATDIPKTRLSSTWVALSTGMIALVVVLVFILQNLHSSSVHFFTASWRIPLGVDLLFAVILGGLLVFCAGSLRILQLRRLAKGRGRLNRRSRSRTLDVTTPISTEPGGVNGTGRTADAAATRPTGDREITP